MIGGLLVFGRTEAQVAQQTVEIATVDVNQAGGRLSGIEGHRSSVVNDSNETIGTIDDLLVSPDGRSHLPCCRSAASSAWAVTWLSFLTTV